MAEKDNLKVIYEILKKVESVQDEKSVHTDEFSGEVFGISEQRYNKIILAMTRAGLIDGFQEFKALGVTTTEMVARNPMLTIIGMEYLSYYSKPETFLRRVEQIVNIVK